MPPMKDRRCGECTFGQPLFLEKIEGLKEITLLTYMDMEGIEHRKLILEKSLGPETINKQIQGGICRCCPNLSPWHHRVVSEDEPCVNRRNYQPRTVEPKD